MQAAPLDPSQAAQVELAARAQELLDGLPIPAAEIGRAAGEPAFILRANDSFRSLARHDERLRGGGVADIDLLSERVMASVVEAVLDGDQAVREFEASVGEHHLQVRIARLNGLDGAPDRCLLTLIDRTLQIGPETSFRPEPLRDGLTGLPNRPAFEQRVAEVLEHPNFAEGSHALLTVRLSASATQGDGDEILLAAARRLLSALRAGDLLARTGPHSFAILMRLERGQPDALELSDRLKLVLAAPFRLSDAETSIECSVECAPLRPVA